MTAVTKEALPNVAQLRPAGTTSADIRNAFYRVLDARAANNAEIARLEGARPSQLLAASPAEIDRADETLRRRRVYGEQLDLLEAELRRTFTIAKEREDDAVFDAELATLQADAATWSADMRLQYTAAAKLIVELLGRERDLIGRYTALLGLPAAERKLDGLQSAVALMAGDMQRAHCASRAFPVSFGEITQLPSLQPGPALWRSK